MYSLRFYVDYLSHFLMSHSRHGTHSPFVYQLVDEVIYAAPSKGASPDKVKQLIERLTLRFIPQTVHRTGNALPQHPLDFVVAEGGGAETTAAQLRELWPQLHADSVLILIGIYRNKRMKVLWRTVQERPDVTVTIDLFHLGLVFFRSGQAKEDFRIRF